MDFLRLIQILALALLQGVAELFPISSLGHTVIIPGLLGWGNLIKSDTFLPLVVTLHLGTAVALLTFFWRDCHLPKADREPVLPDDTPRDPGGVSGVERRHPLRG